MKSAYLLALICFLSGPKTFSQSKVKYQSQNFIGLLEGEAKSAFQLQTLHGVQFHKWYGAVGAGLDYYMYRSIPVFFSLNKDLVFNNRTFFVSGDIGKNYPWISGNNVSIWDGNITEDFSPGFYWAGGMGYKAFFKNKSDAIVINLGYSFKHLKEERSSQAFCPDPPCQVNVEKYDYQLNRISLRLGWQF